MTSPSRAARTAAGLGYVCRHLEELRAVLGDDGIDPSSPLQRLLTALDSPHGQPRQEAIQQIAELLEEVHLAVQGAGDALGVYGYGQGRSGEPAGLESLEIIYRCPLGWCTGRPNSEVTEPRPTCSVSPDRHQLVRERLP